MDLRFKHFDSLVFFHHATSTLHHVLTPEHGMEVSVTSILFHFSFFTDCFMSDHPVVCDTAYFRISESHLLS